MTITRWLTAASVITVAAAALFTGCTNENPDGDKWKSAVAAAYDKNGEISNYALEAKMKVKWNSDGAQQPPVSPIFAGAAAMLASEEGLSWKGAAYTDPLRVEADIALRDDAAKQTYNVPLLIQDNKLYVSIPMLNKENEYFLVDKPLDLKSSVPFDPAVVMGWQKALDTLVPSIISAADARWVRQSASEDEQGPNRIEIAVTDENADDIADAFAAGWSAAIGKLQELKLIGNDTATQWTQYNGKSAKLLPGGTVAVTIDSDGFIAEQSLDVTFTNESHVQLTILKTEVNRQPQMTKPVPDQALPFSDLLKFIAADRAAAKQQ
ncbi:hypothetical protein [Paenibacillus alkalitolerans]|uniref:hypothetical protein n=1 Tax=Paenibacillus alkalitolerans TaxID=2799335 RepID=UPI0018F4F27B|nr:hypothetical protein [Paenibacillus alkalitolerans]